MDDEDWGTLVRGFRDGDPDAVRVFWDRYGPLLHRVADSHMADRLKARVGPEDVVQSACRTFFRRAKAGQLQLDDSEGLWRLLCAITLNKVRKQARYHRQQRRSLDREVPAASSEDSTSGGVPVADHRPAPDEAVAFADEFEQLLDGLNAEERAIVDLKLQDLTHEQAAERLGVSERTVRRVIQRLRAKFGRDLDEPVE